MDNNEKVFVEILRRLRNHPDPERAYFVVIDILSRIAAGEDLEAIEARYAADLAVMKGAKA